MAQVTIDDHTEEVKTAIEQGILTALEMIGLVVEGDAELELSKPKVHADGSVKPNVDTGRLRSSITHEVNNDEKSVRIGTNVEYAPFLELGTVRMPAGYPFLKPALEKNISNGTISKAFKMALDNIGK